MARRSNSYHRPKGLKAAIALLIHALHALPLLAWAMPMQGVAGPKPNWHLPAALGSLKPVGRLPGTNRLNLSIALPLRNTDRLGLFLKDVSTPGSPMYRHYLTPAKFAEQYRPSQADYETVAVYAAARGLEIRARHPNRMLLDISGTVADVERTFHVKMNVYQHPAEPRTFYAPDSGPTIDLATPILDVSGLENYSRPMPLFKTKALLTRQSAVSDAGSGPSGAYMGGDFRAAYVPDTTLTGSGQTVGLLEFDGYTPGDITYYENLAGLPGVTLSNVLLDGFSGQPSGDGGEVEVSLDIEMAISMAPGLTNVIVYEEAPTNGDWHGILNRMADDDLAAQMSCSWYIPDGAPDPVAEQIFQQMDAQGQSFFAANGDRDAYTGLIPFPDDSTNITEVGGKLPVLVRRRTIL